MSLNLYGFCTLSYGKCTLLNLVVWFLYAIRMVFVRFSYGKCTFFIWFLYAFHSRQTLCSKGWQPPYKHNNYITNIQQTELTIVDNFCLFQIDMTVAIQCSVVVVFLFLKILTNIEPSDEERFNNQSWNTCSYMLQWTHKKRANTLIVRHWLVTNKCF